MPRAKKIESGRREKGGVMEWFKWFERLWVLGRWRCPYLEPEQRKGAKGESFRKLLPVEIQWPR